jgi:hypothetical protein
MVFIKGQENRMRKHVIGIAAFFFISLYGNPAAALTPEQVLALKKAGVSDQTIQLMLQQETAVREDPPNDAGTREIKDKDGHAVIIYSAGSRPRHLDAAEQEKLDQAWQMLRQIIIDGRK